MKIKQNILNKKTFKIYKDNVSGHTHYTLGVMASGKVHVLRKKLKVVQFTELYRQTPFYAASNIFLAIA